MARVARAGALTSLEVRDCAVSIASDCPPGDVDAIIAALDRWMRAHFRFVRDPLGQERLHTPAELLADVARRGAAWADCDDAAILAAALALSIGIPARYVAVAFLERRAPYAHVWVELQNGGGGWWIVDPTRGSQMLDWSAVTRVMLLPAV
jgi:Transglutaminase-like superfamily